MDKLQEKDREESVTLSRQFAEIEGRRPRIYIPEMEDDGEHEKRKEAATTFADAGWDVDVGSPEPPEDAAQNAADNDVHFIYYYSTAKSRTSLLVKLIQYLTMLGRDDILVAAAPVTESERPVLFHYGITAAFDKNYTIDKSSLTMLRLLITRSREEDSNL